MNQEDAEGKEGQTKNKRKRSAFELGQFMPQRLLRPPEPEAVGSNPALPESNCISRKQLLVKLLFLAIGGILVHCAMNGLRLSRSERRESG